MNKALFLDRDGTINEYGEYIYKISDFKFIPGVINFIRWHNFQGYKVIVITNQAGIAKGYYKEEDVIKLHKWVDEELLKYNARIDAWYYCPHHPEAIIEKYKINCNCRKPKTGLLEKAITDFDVDITQSLLIGDKIWDIECGKNMGIKSFFIDEINYKR